MDYPTLHWTEATKVLVIRNAGRRPRPVNDGPLSIAMAHPAIRVTFADDAVAHEQWDVFGNSIADRVSNLARKRDGASYVLLLRDLSDADAKKVAVWCGSQTGVVAVASIGEPEFWAAPSNAI